MSRAPVSNLPQLQSGVKIGWIAAIECSSGDLHVDHQLMVSDRVQGRVEACNARNLWIGVGPTAGSIYSVA